MNTRSIERLKDIGWAIARDNPRPFKHVSFILHKNRIVSIGENIRKTHPLAINNRFLEMHSETHAFSKISKKIQSGDLSNLKLVNLRFSSDGSLRMAKPCKICSSWCRNIFRHIYFSTDKGIEYLKESL